MKSYAIFLEGTNFLLSIEGRKKLAGFFITKRVEATSKEEAGQIAVEAAWNDPTVSGQKDKLPAPDIEIKVIHELPWSNKMKDTGYVFFEMEDE